MLNSLRVLYALWLLCYQYMLICRRCECCDCCERDKCTSSLIFTRCEYCECCERGKMNILRCCTCCMCCERCDCCATNICPFIGAVNVVRGKNVHPRSFSRAVNAAKRKNCPLKMLHFLCVMLRDEMKIKFLNWRVCYPFQYSRTPPRRTPKGPEDLVSIRGVSVIQS